MLPPEDEEDAAFDDDALLDDMLPEDVDDMPPEDVDDPDPEDDAELVEPDVDPLLALLELEELDPVLLDVAPPAPP